MPSQNAATCQNPATCDVQDSPEHKLEISFRQIMPTLVLEVAMPIIVFFVLTSYGVSTLLALIAGGVFPALNIGRTYAETRKFQPLGIIVITFIALGTAASFVSGSVFFTQVKESILTAIFGLLCLGSLITSERPLMFYMIRQFIAGDDSDRARWWGSLWQVPRFRAAQRFLTLVWGIIYLIEAPLRVVFAAWLAPAQVVVISPVMAFGVMIALAAWTRQYMVSLTAEWRRTTLD